MSGPAVKSIVNKENWLVVNPTPEEPTGMKSEDTFIDLCKRTESDMQPLSDQYKPDFNRLLHASMGLATEAGELQDTLKKFMFYGKQLDTTNVLEELGDLLWYLAIAIDAMGSTFEQEQDRVIRKLTVRFPDQFNVVDANMRDLDAEREELEK